jgi:hypothetical protein
VSTHWRRIITPLRSIAPRHPRAAYAQVGQLASLPKLKHAGELLAERLLLLPAARVREPPLKSRVTSAQAVHRQPR